MPRRLPPLNALRSFEAAARYESFTRAAEELNVTQGAVSQQVKVLESQLGLRLFNRERQRLTITPAGRDYLVVIREALDHIGAGTERLTQRQGAGVLTVSTSLDFAAKWLVHRLDRFAAAHPGIDLRVSATAHKVDFAREDVDVAVRHGDDNWPGLEATQLCAEHIFVICSPKLLAGRDRLGKPADVLRWPLLRLEDQSKAWERWFGLAGVTAPKRLAGPVLNRASMLIDAAIEGQGVALARTTLTSWDLIGGRIVRPFDLSWKPAGTYWIVSPKATEKVAKVRRFRDWMLAEAADDARKLSEMDRASGARHLRTERGMR
jgi:LysR family glycine cleavage system transcriptional activator